jgi:hypothetical protein
LGIIKLGLISIFFLFLATVAISLLIPSHVRISKAINIHADKDSVLSLIANRKNWALWHPAFIHDESRKSFDEIRNTIRVQNDSVIIMELNQGNKKPVINGWQVYHASPDSLTLQWYMDFNQGWLPWQKFGSLFYENTYGVLMEQGLTNIKKIVQGRNDHAF